MTVVSDGSDSGFDRKAVILRGDLDLAGPQFLDRVIRAAMAELQLEGLAADGQPEDLMAEADAEHRHVGVRQLPDVVDRVRRARRDRPDRCSGTRRRARWPAGPRRAPSPETRARRSRRPASRRRMLYLMPKS